MTDEKIPNITEEQANNPGINDWVEMKAFAERKEELARERGRKNAEFSFEPMINSM